MTMDLAEAMAVAILKGDRAAAYALADLLREERAERPVRAADARTGRLQGPPGREVYYWPEFRALADRLGLAWGLHTIEVTLTIPAEGTAEIVHEYLRTDPGATA